MDGTKYELNEEVIKSLKPARVFKPSPQEINGRINSISFHHTDDILVTTGDDDVITLYDAVKGSVTSTVYSKKYGCKHVVFTHHPSCILYSSTKGGQPSILYHSLYDNRYLRMFKGHSDVITSLALSAKDDVFLSASQDKTVRMWDLRSAACIGKLDCPGHPSVAFDEQGLIFAVSADNGIIKLFDAKQYSKGPFETFQITEEKNSPVPFHCLKFSLDGKKVLAVSESKIYVMDAFTGKVWQKLSNQCTDTGQTFEACFTPDGQFVISGCADRSIRVWDSASREVFKYESQHADVPQCIKFSPRMILMASGCVALNLWLPSQKVLERNKAG